VKEGGFTETGITRALDEGGLSFFRRFQIRLLAYLLALSFVSSVVAGGIYYSRQVKFVRAEQTQRGRTLISNLAGQSELGAYSGDAAFLFGPARRAFQEADVNYAVIYDRKGKPLIRMIKPGVEVDIGLSSRLLQQVLSQPTQRPVHLHHEAFDDLLAPIASVVDDPERSLFGTDSEPASVAIGVARLGLSHKPARKKLDEVLRWGILLALVVLAMGVSIALILSRRISRPILSLARGADEVRRGNLGFQVELKRPDELGLMAESFNRMSSKLRQTVESLAHLNRHLEQEVANRTQDLRRSRDFVALLNAPLQLDKLLDRALRALLNQTGARVGAVFLRRTSGELDLVVSQGAHADDFRVGSENPPCINEAAASGKPVVVDSLPKTLPLARENEQTKVLLCVPVQFQERLEAALVVGLSSKPSPDLVDFVEHACSELAITVSNARAFSSAERLAKELEQRNVALLQQRDQLLEVSRLKSEFLTNISHELRTPLNAIIGYTELLNDGLYGPLTAEQEQSLEGIGENATNLVSLINQILDLSRVEAGRMKVKLKEVDLAHLVREVLDQTAPLTKDRPYDVGFELPQESLRVRTDPIMVRQILVNLVSNAIKFTKAGSVEVSAISTDEDDIHLSVVDTGIGIRPEHLELIFDEFRQVDGSSTRQHGGTGLGLAISKKFASLLGGYITVKSNYGKGSDFTLILKHARITSVTGEHPLPEVPVTIGESDAR
jgi:signal transduction histidine kinase